MRKLQLDDLKSGIGGLTEAFGTFLVEAAMYCLEENNHRGSAILQVKGDFEEKFEIIWTDQLTEEVRNSWHDHNEATEYGATAIAILLIKVLTKFDRFRRTKGGTDYIISRKDNLGSQIPDFSYLEISGLWNESKGNTINMRINVKKKQVKRTVVNAPAFIIVTEFGSPKTKIVEQ